MKENCNFPPNEHYSSKCIQILLKSPKIFLNLFFRNELLFFSFLFVLNTVKILIKLKNKAIYVILEVMMCAEEAEAS